MEKEFLAKMDVTLKERLDEVYNIGVKNGGIFMKNKILKSLNRDWNLFKTKSEIDLMIKILKKINRLKISLTHEK